MKKLYIGNLPFSATEEQLNEWFAQVGVTPSGVNLIRDRFTGQSRGFAFVEVTNDEDADRAVNSLNGQNFGGRNLVVNEARPKLNAEAAVEEGGQVVAVVATAAAGAATEAAVVDAAAEAAGVVIAATAAGIVVTAAIAGKWVLSKFSAFLSCKATSSSFLASFKRPVSGTTSLHKLLSKDAMP